MPSSSRRLGPCAAASYIGSALFLSSGMVALSDQPLRADPPLFQSSCRIPTECHFSHTEEGGIHKHTGTACDAGTFCETAVFCDEGLCDCKTRPLTNPTRVTCID
jgi:hypothetical protein